MTWKESNRFTITVAVGPTPKIITTDITFPSLQFKDVETTIKENPDIRVQNLSPLQSILIYTWIEHTSIAAPNVYIPLRIFFCPKGFKIWELEVLCRVQASFAAIFPQALNLCDQYILMMASLVFVINYDKSQSSPTVPPVPSVVCTWGGSDTPNIDVRVDVTDRDYIFNVSFFMIKHSLHSDFYHEKLNTPCIGCLLHSYSHYCQPRCQCPTCEEPDWTTSANHSVPSR